MPRAAWIAGAIGVILLGAFLAGRWSRPSDPETSPALLAARAQLVMKDSLRRADSAATVRARVRTDSAIAVANRAVRRANVAEAVSAAYSDTVRVFSDSLLIVAQAGGVRDTVTVPPAVIDRLRADESTIGAQRAAMDSLGRALVFARFERDTSWRAIASATDELRTQKDNEKLEVAAAYAHGKRVGRQQGLVIGTIGTVSVVFAGVKVVQAAK